MKPPKPIYIKPGEDPTDREYQVPGMSCSSCLTIILCCFAGAWLFYIWYQTSKPMPTAGLPTMAHSSTPVTPTITNTPTITFTPSATLFPTHTPTGTLSPSLTPTENLETRTYGLFTATAYTLTPTYTPSITFTPTFTRTPRPTRRPLQPRSPAQPTNDPAQPPAPIIAPTFGQPPIQYTPLPPGWQPSPIWNGQPLPTIDFGTATSVATEELTAEPTLESITETPTPTITMIPTETPTEVTQ